MRTVIVCRSGPDSLERATREPCILSRLCAAAAHSISKRGGLTLPRNSAGYQPLRMRAGGIDDRTNLRAGILSTSPQFLPALNFIPVLKASGSLIPGLRRALQPRKQSRNGFAKGLQNSILSAGSAGLVTASDRHRSSERKSACRAEKFSLRSMN